MKIILSIIILLNPSVLVLFQGEHGHKVEALEPDIDRGEARLGQPFAVGGDGFGDEHIFERGAFLADFEVGIAVCALKIVVDIDQQPVQMFVGKDHLFGEDQHPAGAHAPVYFFQQPKPPFGGDELKGKVENYRRSIGDFCCNHIPFNDTHTCASMNPLDRLAAARHHGRRVVDRDDLAVFGIQTACHREGCRAERATQVVEVAAGLGIVLRQRFNHGDDGAVARNRALDHVGKNIGHLRVEVKVGNVGQRVGIDVVFVHEWNVAQAL